MNKPRVALDADGVLVSFLGGFEYAVEKVIGKPIERQSLVWSLQHAYALTDKEYGAAWDIFKTEHLYSSLPSMPGALDAVKLLKEAGFDVHVVTAIMPEYLEDRKLNLNKLGFDPTHVHATGGAGGEVHGCKIAALKEIQPLMFADDQLKYLKDSPFVPVRAWINTEPAQIVAVDDVCYTHKAESLLEFVQQWLKQSVSFSL